MGKWQQHCPQRLLAGLQSRLLRYQRLSLLLVIKCNDGDTRTTSKTFKSQINRKPVKGIRRGNKAA